MDLNLNAFLEGFNTASKKPYNFLSVQEDLSEDIKGLLKNIYDYTKCNEEKCDKQTLPHLVVSGFDDEQIWQELELQNGVFTFDTIELVAQLSAKRDKLTFPLKLKCNKNDSESNKFDHLEDNENSEIIDNIESENEEPGELSESKKIIETKLKKTKLKPSIVDDKFFKLSELELFLQNEEKKEENPEKETLDLFGNTDDDAADYKYSDFFDNPNEELGAHDEDGSVAEDDDFDEDMGGNDNEYDYEDVDSKSDDGETVKESKKRKISDTDNDSSEEEQIENEAKSKKVRFSLLDSDQSDADEPADNFDGNKKGNKRDGPKSSYEERQERLGRMIQKLEEEALSEKPWQMVGEVTGNSRPQNSLLEEIVDFDLSVRPAPVMTEEVTMRLEDIIKRRIKDKAWDDVERKIKPVDTPSEFKKKLALDQEKSKLSLAEVYEQEYIKQREAAATTEDDTERQETEPALHVEVRNMLTSLFNKLDALSNYHYTPRPVAPELKVVSNVAAVMMEEVAPVTTADSALLAPEEIKSKKRESQLMSKEERTATDKKRARRIKKTKQRQRQRDKEKRAKEIAKLNPGLGNKYSKSKTDKELLDVTNNVTKMDESKDKSIKSSTAFFNKLQDEVKSQIKTKTYAKKKDKRILTAKRLKL